VIITFEGGEGAGKSTNAAYLGSYLTSKGLPWLSFREPGGSSFSEEVRELFLKQDLDVMSELLLILASRAQNISRIVEPGLAEGTIIIIDRFVDSTLVYQGIVGGLGYEKVKDIMELTGTWIEPDLTFIMDVSPEMGLSRIKPSDRFEQRGQDYHQGIRDAFLRISCNDRHRIIDTSLGREDVQERIIKEVDAALYSVSFHKPFKNQKTS
jgi:dTMP kinase